MDAALPVKIDREKAAELYRAYQIHQHYEKPIDEEIRRTYRLISEGKVIIQALESVARAGLDEDGWPKLAIARADQTKTICTISRDGSATMAPTSWIRRHNGVSTINFQWKAGTFTGRHDNRSWHAEAYLPLIPIAVRPKRGIENYTVLWEAEWTGKVPFDPLLLRRIGRADLWLVVAAWELTEIERAALSTRVNVR